MTDEDKIKRISKCLNDLHLKDMTRDEYEEKIMQQSIYDIIDELWYFYCFVSDVCDTLNM